MEITITENLVKNVVEFSPYKNDNVISIIKQPDGNYIGYMHKFDKVISVRDIGPEAVLQRLLTHDGTDNNG